MKILAFAVRKDELLAFDRYSRQFNLDISLVEKSLSPESVSLAQGYDMVTFLGNCIVNEFVLNQLKSYGIKYIASRSTGYNNIDLKIAKKLGISVSNSTYSPYSVSEFALMSTMMMLRNLPKTIKHIEKNNFSLNGLIGKELRNQKIGVIGTGKIGKIVYNSFKCLGAQVMAYDIFKSDENINYVSLNELFKESDVITLHVPLTDENKHIINKNSIEQMKNGVIIVNTARGELINLNDLIDGLKNQKISGAALDTFEKELGIVHKDCSANGFDNNELKELLSLENVLITSHQAFYTDQAVSDMVESALTNLSQFEKTGTSSNNLIDFSAK